MTQINNNEFEVRTVNIPIDEYFDLRSKAEMNVWLTNELSELKARFCDLERRLWELEHNEGYREERR